MKLKTAFFFVLIFSLTFRLAPTLGADSNSEFTDRAQDAFRKGKNLYDQRRYAEAFREWDAVLPSLDGQPVKKTIEFLKSRVKDVVIEPVQDLPATPTVPVEQTPASLTPTEPVASTAPLVQTAEPVSEGALEAQAPKGMEETLAAAEKKIKQETRSASREVAGLRREKERVLKLQKGIDVSFEEGKGAFRKGDMDRAISEWEKILPYLKDPQDLKRRLESLRISQKRLDSLKDLDLQTQKTGEPSLEMSEISKQLKILLENSNADLVARAKEEMKSRQVREREVQEKNEEAVRLRKDFESGRDLLGKGEYDRAAQAWEKILPSLESREELKEKLNELKENNRRVKEISALLAAKDPQALRLEEAPQEKEINKLLQEASLRLNDEIRDLESKKSAKEGIKANTKAGREADIEKTFQKGKALYAKGQVIAAVDVWEKIVPYLQNRRLIEDLIKDVRLHSEHIQRLKNAPVKVSSPSPDTRLLQVEVEIEPLLRDASTKLSQEEALGPLENHQFYLEKKLPSVAARRKETEKREALEAAQAAQRKKAWIRSTFEEGRVMYESGRTREAFLLWDALTPYLSKEPEIKSYIKKASQAPKAASKTPTAPKA